MMKDDGLPIWKKIAKPVVLPPARLLLVWAASLWRPRLSGVCFVGVTGSVGKTTTKNLLAAALRRTYRVRANRSSLNGLYAMARLILTTRRRDDYVVQEFGAFKPGSLAAPVRLIKPNIAVVTTITRDHYKCFRGRAGAALEKRTLVKAIPEDGLVILNADDPHVLGMREATRARVITFGYREGADFRGLNIRSAWPDRLRMEIEWRGGRYPVQTRLPGKLWSLSILAATAAAVSCGVPIQEVLDAIAEVEPEKGRVSPFPVGEICFVDDAWKGSYDTLPAVFEFMREAQAARKVLVFGMLADFAGDSSRKYRAAARNGLAVADRVVFVGPFARCALRAHPGDDRLQAFTHFREAADYLANELRAGDLVYLKSSAASHLERLALGREKPLSCFRNRCAFQIHCSRCRLV